VILGFYLVQFLTGLSDASALFMVACGLSLIFGVLRVVNLAHGSFYMVGAYIAFYVIASLPQGPFFFWTGILLAAFCVGLIGIIIETLLLRRLYRAPELFILFATFGVVLIFQDLSRWLFGAEDILGQMAPGLDGSIDIMGTLLPQYDIALIVIAPIILVGLWLLLNHTRWGILVRAATEDREMSSALGVDQTWLFTTVFFLGSCLAGLGGAVQLPKGGANLLMDLNMIAAAFVIVVVGGMGSIPGAYLASVIIGQLNSFGILIFPQSTLFLMFLAMALVLIIRPHGLFGTAETQEHGAAEAAESVLKPASKKLRLLGLILLIFIFVMPVFVGKFTLVLMNEIALFALVSMSLYFLMTGGMVTFGHAAFFGGGAYTAALLVHHLQTPMELAVFLAPMAAGLLALIIGWFCVRLSGVYFAILTLAFAQICWSVVFQWGGFTGGDDGILSIWPAEWASGKIVFYYLTMVLCIGGILTLRYFIFTPFGYTMRACRDSALRVDAIGINLRRHQWLAFTVAGVFAGLAGGIYAFSKGSVFPDEMAIPRSFEFLFMVLLGGVDALFGPVAGSAAFTWLHDKIARFDFWQLAIGCIFIFLVVAFPQGIAGSIHNRLGKYFED
jgi:branched-chain amino acid transport system permease protein